jgi:hypothetical protein
MQTSTARWGSAPNDMVLSSSSFQIFKKETFNEMLYSAIDVKGQKTNNNVDLAKVPHCMM